MKRFTTASVIALAVASIAPAAAQDATGLLFRASADNSLTADYATGDPVPNFRSGVDVTPDGAIGGACGVAAAGVAGAGWPAGLSCP